jgi:hypothetical protein
MPRTLPNPSSETLPRPATTGMDARRVSSGCSAAVTVAKTSVCVGVSGMFAAAAGVIFTNDAWRLGISDA